VDDNSDSTKPPTFPTQLDIHGQWWSNCSTHRLQVGQCLDRTGLII